MNPCKHSGIFTNICGSTLVTSSVAATIVSIMAAGYLRWVTNAHILNVRAHAWLQALHLAEAGIEAGFAELQYQFTTARIKDPLSTSGFGYADGWINLGGGSYSRTFSDVSMGPSKNNGSVTVTVSGVGYSANPVIVAVGTCAAPVTGHPISRAVRVRLHGSKSYPMGIICKTLFEGMGNKVYLDSFDSRDPTKSTNGLYDPLKRQANSGVGAEAGMINIGNADVYGTIGFRSGTVTLGPSGSVGPTFDVMQRATTVPAGIAKGYIWTDFTTDIPNVVLPGELALLPDMGVLDYDVSLPLGGAASGKYRYASMSPSSSKVIRITGDVTIYVSGNVDIGGQIIINPGAKLTVYCGTNFILRNGVTNLGGLSENNSWYGLPTCLNVDIKGQGNWRGVVYTPQAYISFTGGGAAGDVSGSFVCNRVKLSGEARFHFDEALAKVRMKGYSIVSWQVGRISDGIFTPD